MQSEKREKLPIFTIFHAQINKKKRKILSVSGANEMR